MNNCMSTLGLLVFASLSAYSADIFQSINTLICTKASMEQPVYESLMNSGGKVPPGLLEGKYPLIHALMHNDAEKIGLHVKGGEGNLDPAKVISSDWHYQGSELIGIISPGKCTVITLEVKYPEENAAITGEARYASDIYELNVTFGAAQDHGIYYLSYLEMGSARYEFLEGLWHVK